MFETDDDFDLCDEDLLSAALDNVENGGSFGPPPAKRPSFETGSVLRPAYPLQEKNQGPEVTSPASCSSTCKSKTSPAGWTTPLNSSVRPSDLVSPTSFSVGNIGVKDVRCGSSSVVRQEKFCDGRTIKRCAPNTLRQGPVPVSKTSENKRLDNENMFNMDDSFDTDLDLSSIPSAIWEPQNRNQDGTKSVMSVKQNVTETVSKATSLTGDHTNINTLKHTMVNASQNRTYPASGGVATSQNVLRTASASVENSTLSSNRPKQIDSDISSLRTLTVPLQSSNRASPAVSPPVSPGNHSPSSSTPTVSHLRTPNSSLGTVLSSAASSSASSKRKRKFPGPAGALPRLKPGVDLNAIPVQNTATPRMPMSQLTEPLSQVPCSQSVEDAFNDSAWLKMKRDLDPQATKMLNLFSLSNALRKAGKKLLPNGKVPVVCAVVDSINLDNADAGVALRDPSGEMKGTIHREIFETILKHKEEKIQVGSVLVLRQVGVFSPSTRSHYLNITLNNVVRIYSKDSEGNVDMERTKSEFQPEDFVVQEVKPPVPKPHLLQAQGSPGSLGQRPILRAAPWTTTGGPRHSPPNPGGYRPYRPPAAATSPGPRFSPRSSPNTPVIRQGATPGNYQGSPRFPNANSSYSSRPVQPSYRPSIQQNSGEAIFPPHNVPRPSNQGWTPRTTSSTRFGNPNTSNTPSNSPAQGHWGPSTSGSSAPNSANSTRFRTPNTLSTHSNSPSGQGHRRPSNNGSTTSNSTNSARFGTPNVSNAHRNSPAEGHWRPSNNESTRTIPRGSFCIQPVRTASTHIARTPVPPSNVSNNRERNLAPVIQNKNIPRAMGSLQAGSSPNNMRTSSGHVSHIRPQTNPNTQSSNSVASSSSKFSFRRPVQNNSSSNVSTPTAPGGTNAAKISLTPSSTTETNLWQSDVSDELLLDGIGDELFEAW